MKVHELKIDPMFWGSLVIGEKKAEIRINDRDYKVGDILEFYPFSIKGGSVLGGSMFKENVRRVITHIVDCGDWGLPVGYCMLSMAPVCHQCHGDSTQCQCAWPAMQKKIERIEEAKHEIEQAAECIGMVSNHTEDDTAIHYVDMAREKAEKAVKLLEGKGV
jgi:hypothetical protein